MIIVPIGAVLLISCVLLLGWYCIYHRPAKLPSLPSSTQNAPQQHVPMVTHPSTHITTEGDEIGISTSEDEQDDENQQLQQQQRKATRWIEIDSLQLPITSPTAVETEEQQQPPSVWTQLYYSFFPIDNNAPPPPPPAPIPLPQMGDVAFDGHEEVDEAASNHSINPMSPIMSSASAAGSPATRSSPASPPAVNSTNNNSGNNNVATPQVGMINSEPSVRVFVTAPTITTPPAPPMTINTT